MEASGSVLENNEEQALKVLLDTFGSVFSLREIASAYCRSGRNADLAGEILYNLHGSTSSCVTDELKGQESSESSYGNISEQSCPADGNSEASKQKRCPASMGTVSCVIGKDYIRSTPLANGSSITTKPLKLDSKEFPMSEIWGYEAETEPAKHIGMHQDIEDFLFQMLGDGFQMERDVIREVLDRCGYDIQKSADKLLYLSAMSSDERNGFPSEPAEKFSDISPKSKSSSSQNNLLHVNGSDENNERITSSRQQNGIDDLQKEVLAALFNAHEIPDQPPVRTPAMKAVEGSRALGEVVVEPPRDPIAEHKTSTMYMRQDDKDDSEEDSYQVLRRAVKEYRATMKEYYTAAVNTFAEGDRAKSSKLLEQGHFFHQKAREADEESAQKIFETRNVDTQDILSLDLHDHGAKEAIRLLKCHLSSLSGIPSIKYLKVIVEANDEDITKGARKRRIIKLLEKESIKWIEEGTAGTILISVDKINRKRLSFATKSTL